MKKIYIHGSFMNDNYGDYLLFDIVYRQLNNKDELDVYSNNVSKSYDQYISVKRKSKLKVLLQSEKFVFAGGGYFGEPDKNKLIWNIRFFFKHGLFSYLISKSKKPYVILGVGAGPFTSKINTFIVKRVFNGASIITVRDFISKEYLKNIGVKKDINVIPDWILGMNLNNLLINKTISEKEFEKVNQYKVLIHLTTKLETDKDSGLTIVVNELKSLFDNEYNYLCFACDQQNEKQTKRALHIMNTMDTRNKVLKPYNGPWELSSLINEMDLIITDKLHVGIVAKRLGKKVVSVAAHSKTVRFYNTINNNECCKHLSKIKKGDFIKLVKQVSAITYDNQEIFEKAKENQKILLNFINEENEKV